MKPLKLLAAVVLGLSVVATLACSGSDSSTPQQFSKIALKGKKVFETHRCNECHYVGDEEVLAEAPDLTDPFLANDSSFVQAHLKFVEDSKMPPIEMTEEEMRQVSYYIAELHAAKHSAMAEDEADARCPICYAPVSKTQAEEKNLVANFRETKYYFECRDCLVAFQSAPEVFIELMNQYPPVQ